MHMQTDCEKDFEECSDFLQETTPTAQEQLLHRGANTSQENVQHHQHNTLTSLNTQWSTNNSRSNILHGADHLDDIKYSTSLMSSAGTRNRSALLKHSSAKNRELIALLVDAVSSASSRDEGGNNQLANNGSSSYNYTHQEPPLGTITCDTQHSSNSKKPRQIPDPNFSIYKNNPNSKIALRSIFVHVSNVMELCSDANTSEILSQNRNVASMSTAGSSVGGGGDGSIVYHGGGGGQHGTMNDYNGGGQHGGAGEVDSVG